METTSDELLASRDAPSKGSLLEALSESRSSFSKAPLEKLEHIRCPEGIVNALILALADKNRNIRQNALLSLREIGTPAVSLLVAALAHDNESIRQGVTRALGEIGTLAEIAAPALILALEDANETVRWSAAYSLGKRRAGGGKALMKTAWGDRNETVRRIASLAVGQFCVPTEYEIPAFFLALQDVQEIDRWFAVCEREQLGTEEVVPFLMHALDDTYEVVHQNAIYALGLIGPPAELAVPALIQALDEADEVVSKLAAEALGKIGNPVAVVVPALIASLANPIASVSQKSAEALLKIGAPAIDKLYAARQSDNATVRQAVLKILAEIAPDRLANDRSETESVSPQDQQILDWFNVVDPNTYLEHLQVFWCIGRLDRKAMKSAGRAMGLGSLETLLIQYKARYKGVDLTVSEPHLRLKCMKSLDKLFIREPFYTQAWSDEVRDQTLREQDPESKKYKLWTRKAWMAWNYVDRYVNTKRLDPEMDFEDNDL